MAYKRTKTDSALYCPYCGHGFNMNYERYRAMYEAHKDGKMYAQTTCKTCDHEFLFRNMAAETVRKTGIRAVMKLERG